MLYILVRTEHILLLIKLIKQKKTDGLISIYWQSLIKDQNMPFLVRLWVESFQQEIEMLCYIVPGQKREKKSLALMLQQITAGLTGDMQVAVVAV